MKNDELLKADAERVAAHLKANHLGKDNATTNGQLSLVLEMEDLGSGGREGQPGSAYLSKLLLKARELGHPVVSEKKGIFYAQYFDEIEHGMNHMLACALTYENNALMLERAAQGLPRRAA